MALGNATVDGSDGVSSRAVASFETNRLYAPDVLDIQDLWQWESLGSGVSKTKPFALEGLDPSSPENARLVVHLQGGSDAVSVVDHHVQLFLNGALVAEETFDGAVPHRMEADVPVSLLAAANELRVTERGRHRCLLPRLPRPLRRPLSPTGSRALRGLRRRLLGFRDGRGRRDRLPRRSPRRHDGVLAHRLRGRAFPPLPRRGRAPLPRRLFRGRPLASRLLPRAFRPPALHPEPGRLRPRRSQGLPRRRPAPPRPQAGPGSLHLRRLPRGDRLLLRRRAGLRPGHPRLPLLRLPPVATALAPLRPPPRRRQPRPEALQPRLTALPHALPPPEDLLHLDRLRPRSRRPQRGRRPSRPRHRAASRHHARPGPDDGRQGPRLGGPGTQPRRHGRPRRRQPRSRRRLRGRRPRHRELLPRGKGHDRGLPRSAAQPGRGSRPDPRRLQPGTLPDLLRRARRRRRLGRGEHPQLLRPLGSPRPAASALHAHHELPQRLLHRALLRVPRRGIPQGAGKGHDRLLLTQRPVPRRTRAPLPPRGHAGDHEPAAPAARRRHPRRAEDLRPVRRLPGAPLPLPPLR